MPSRATLERFGNTSLSSTFYILANIESTTGVKRGEKARARQAAAACSRQGGPGDRWASSTHQAAVEVECCQRARKSSCLFFARIGCWLANAHSRGGVPDPGSRACARGQWQSPAGGTDAGAAALPLAGAALSMRGVDAGPAAGHGLGLQGGDGGLARAAHDPHAARGVAAARCVLPQGRARHLLQVRARARPPREA